MTSVLALIAVTEHLAVHFTEEDTPTLLLYVQEDWDKKRYASQGILRPRTIFGFSIVAQKGTSCTTRFCHKLVHTLTHCLLLLLAAHHHGYSLS